MRRRHRRTCGSRCASYIPVYRCYPERAWEEEERERERKDISRRSGNQVRGEEEEKDRGGEVSRLRVRRRYTR